MTAEYEFCKMMLNKYPLIARADISDIMEATLRYENSYPLGCGHGKRYWATHNVNTEAFAEMYSATISNPESLEVIKTYLPKSYNVFLEMLEAVK